MSEAILEFKQDAVFVVKIQGAMELPWNKRKKFKKGAKYVVEVEPTDNDGTLRVNFLHKGDMKYTVVSKDENDTTVLRYV